MVPAMHPAGRRASHGYRSPGQVARRPARAGPDVQVGSGSRPPGKSPRRRPRTGPGGRASRNDRGARHPDPAAQASWDYHARTRAARRRAGAGPADQATGGQRPGNRRRQPGCSAGKGQRRSWWRRRPSGRVPWRARRSVGRRPGGECPGDGRSRTSARRPPRRPVPRRRPEPRWPVSLMPYPQAPARARRRATVRSGGRPATETPERPAARQPRSPPSPTRPTGWRTSWPR
jgi:hypothetical protein